MPEPVRTPSEEAVRRIAESLARAGITGEALPSYEVSRYRNENFVAGWEFYVSFADRPRHLRLLVPRDAPWEFSRVALVEAPYLKWPHVDRDGLLCLRPDTWTIDPQLPDKAAIAELASAEELIERLIGGGVDAEFRDEFRSYWDRICNSKLEPVYSIALPAPPTRRIYVWRGEKFALVGDSPEAVVAWLRSRFPDSRDKAWAVEQAGFIWADLPPIPSEFPDSIAKLREFAGRSNADLLGLLDGFEASDGGEFLVVMGARSASGTGLFGVSISQNTNRYGYRSLTSGFREGKVPPSLMASRVLGGKVTPRIVERADAAWVHGRDQDTRQEALQQARVAILGCGSVGGQVAALLASAGVGSFLFVDPESLTWANVGRHVLGADFVGKSKADSLARVIGTRLPNIKHLDAELTGWQDMMRRSPDKLARNDLIISAMGDWSSEAHLNAWHQEHAPAALVLYGWTEAFCCAGHAVAIRRGTGCLQCGFTALGNPAFQVGRWENGSTLLQEPACGSDFQPYGPIELAHVCATIAEFALDCLLAPPVNSVHTIWAGSERLLAATEGEWTDEWRRETQGQPPGSRLAQRDWSKNPACSVCGNRDNA